MDGHSGPGGGRVPLTLIGEAVFARCLSARKEEREAASKIYPHQKLSFTGDEQAMIEKIKDALFASKIISYTQGYDLMRTAAGHLWLESELRRDCADVERRLYYPERFPEPDKRGL